MNRAGKCPNSTIHSSESSKCYSAVPDLAQVDSTSLVKLPPASPRPPHPQYYGEQGLLDNTPLPLALERDRDPRLAASPLRFPGASGSWAEGMDGRPVWWREAGLVAAWAPRQCMEGRRALPGASS